MSLLVFSSFVVHWSNSAKSYADKTLHMIQEVWCPFWWFSQLLHLLQHLCLHFVIDLHCFGVKTAKEVYKSDIH